MINLKGMTWDHERGYGPLLSTTEGFRSLNPEINIEWDRRSLKDFGDYPVHILARKYDLILIDHPHVGNCSEQGVLVPLNEWLSADYLTEQKTNSVGSSYDSYNLHGSQWALAVDTAAQVSAYREDLISGQKLPETWQDVYRLADTLPHPAKVGMPLCPTDAICTFITLCAQFGGDYFFDEVKGIDPQVGEEVAAFLLKLLPILHPKSLDFNPILILDEMAMKDEIAYVPLLFGYSNYSRPGTAGHLIRFTNIPSESGEPRGSILGGVGMAVSAFSKHIGESVKYAAYAATGDVQRTVYFQGGGQPGHLSAWTDTKVNRASNHFFENTLDTLKLSHVRPRHKEFPMFQEKSGELLHGFLKKASTGEEVGANEIVAALNGLYQSLLKGKQYDLKGW